MAEKNIDKNSKYYWTEYDGEDIDIDTVGELSEDEKKEADDIMNKLMSRNKNIYQESAEKTDDKKSAFEIAKEKLADK